MQTLFPKKAILEVQDASKVNYFATEMILCEYAEFYKIYFQIFFLHICLIQFFSKRFCEKMQIWCISKFSSSTNHSAQNVRSVLGLFLKNNSLIIFVNKYSLIINWTLLLYYFIFMIYVFIYMNFLYCILK